MKYLNLYFLVIICPFECEFPFENKMRHLCCFIIQTQVYLLSFPLNSETVRRGKLALLISSPRLRPGIKEKYTCSHLLVRSRDRFQSSCLLQLKNEDFLSNLDCQNILRTTAKNIKMGKLQVASRILNQS
jgi:hypothetical protein